MREFDAATGDYIASRAGIYSRHLVWVVAKNRATGADEAMGLWTGEDAVVFNIDGVERTYFGAGAMVQLEPIRAGIGLGVRIHQFSLSPLAPEVAQLIRGYDTRLATVEVHRALFNLDTGALAAAPVRVLAGWVNSLKLSTAAEGGESQATIDVASASRALTKTLSLFRSDAAQRRVSANDAFRQYSDISGAVGVWWGEKRAGQDLPTAPAPRRYSPVDYSDKG